MLCDWVNENLSFTSHVSQSRQSSVGKRWRLYIFTAIPCEPNTVHKTQRNPYFCHIFFCTNDIGILDLKLFELFCTFLWAMLRFRAPVAIFSYHIFIQYRNQALYLLLTLDWRGLIGSLRYFLCCDWPVGKYRALLAILLASFVSLTITFTLSRLEYPGKLGNRALCVLLTSRMVITRVNPRISVVDGSVKRHGYLEIQNVGFVPNWYFFRVICFEEG